MDGMGLGLLGVRAARIEAESARPWAPVLPHRARGSSADRYAAAIPVRAARPRRVLARALHRAADAVAPASNCVDPAR
ncbi:hypothetical protein [Actinotalea sp. K2]|uniref:hypothetical protein n=1 Tax=Actinotalea sp. K2 TaxID=2939438 RepID=UPI0020173161|nr:hypothetical protein [Actinotalea sp. K2]MCL3862503.1 hypothetical protein [Actinotalea sp. K2]